MILQAMFKTSSKPASPTSSYTYIHVSVMIAIALLYFQWKSYMATIFKHKEAIICTLNILNLHGTAQRQHRTCSPITYSCLKCSLLQTQHPPVNASEFYITWTVFTKATPLKTIIKTIIQQVSVPVSANFRTFNNCAMLSLKNITLQLLLIKCTSVSL